MDPVAKLVSQKFGGCGRFGNTFNTGYENKIIFEQFPEIFFKWMSTQNIFQAAITSIWTPETA